MELEVALFMKPLHLTQLAWSCTLIRHSLFSSSLTKQRECLTDNVNRTLHSVREILTTRGLVRCPP